MEPWVRLPYLSIAFTLIAVHDREEAPYRSHTFGQSLDTLIDVHDRSKVPHHRSTFGQSLDTLWPTSSTSACTVLCRAVWAAFFSFLQVLNELQFW